MKKQILLYSILFLSMSTLFAQNAKKKVDFKKHTLQQTFDSIYQYSNNYQEFKVVKRVWLQSFKKKLADSVQAEKIATQKLQKTIANQNIKVSSLTAQIETLNNSVATVNADKDSIEFLGLNLLKSDFKNIFWGVSALLLALLGFFIFQFQNSNSSTKIAKSELKNIEQEFEAHRKIALEREQKVMRKLQDEINKHRA